VAQGVDVEDVDDAQVRVAAEGEVGREEAIAFAPRPEPAGHAHEQEHAGREEELPIQAQGTGILAPDRDRVRSGTRSGPPQNGTSSSEGKSWPSSLAAGPRPWE
jgi:hypothetical protein